MMLDLRHLKSSEKKLEQLRKGYSRSRIPEDIAEVAMWTGIRWHGSGKETARLLEMEEYLHKRVAGRMSRSGDCTGRPARTGLKDPKRPIGIHVPGADRRRQDAAGEEPGRVPVRLGRGPIKLDMSEFMSGKRQPVGGAPPGYVATRKAAS